MSSNATLHDDAIKSDAPHVLDILQEMRRLGLQPEFIGLLMQYSLQYEGLKGLMEMWMSESDPKERENIVADLQESLEDIVSAPSSPEERPYICFDDLEKIKKDIGGFKANLRQEVDRRGGISELARRTGIPQPSLSRFFSSASMPRRTTLYKIAQALELSESSIAFRWMR